MDQQCQQTVGACHPLRGHIGPWCLGAIWHQRGAAAVSTAAVLGMCQSGNLWAGFVCRAQVPPHQPVARFAAATALGGLSITLFILLVNGLILGTAPATLSAGMWLLVQTGVIVAAVNGVFVLTQAENTPRNTFIAAPARWQMRWININYGDGPLCQSQHNAGQTLNFNAI